MDINNLTRQHGEIIELAAKISSYQTEQHVKDNAFEISLLLGQMSGKITMHLSSEDKFLYPKLMVHADQRVKVTGKQFFDEMGDLSKVFGDYKTRYMGAKRIAENAGAFITETKTVFSALAKRIEREGETLYPLVSSL